ncbi:MAG: mevalonate kinase [Bellilinea sp.]
MPAITSFAPAKLILFGEHSVVYDRPAIAIPFTGVHARAAIFAMPVAPSGQVQIDAQAVQMDKTLDQLDPDDPIAITIHGVMDKFGISSLPAMHIRLTSTIPIAAGMGSSAAVSVALARALSTFLGHPLPDADINDIAFKVEQQLHFTPSGVDNTVITYARPVYFVRSQPLEFLHVLQPFDLIIADSGISAATGPMVSGVRERFNADPARYNALFDKISSIVLLARDCIEHGSAVDLGPLLIENHALLKGIGVSTPELDILVEAAMTAGALGAKLTGGGGGGNIIALAPEDRIENIQNALLAAGAHQVWTAKVLPPQEPFR